MSKKIELFILPESRFNESNPKTIEELNQFYFFGKIGEYYKALYCLENILLKDGTSQKYCNIFLNFILDNFDNLIKDINMKKQEVLNMGNKKTNKLKNNPCLEDVEKFDFYYLRNCFDKYELCIDFKNLEIIRNKKLKHNQKIINKNIELKKSYEQFINNLISENNNLTPNQIYNTINDFNNRIKGDVKLFFIYQYLDCNLIENNHIFNYLINDIFYLNKFYFGNFDNFGIPIGLCDNMNLLYRYLFMLIRDKINEKSEKLIKSKEAVYYIFKSFKSILYYKNENIENKSEKYKYFIFIFVNIIFDVYNTLIKRFNPDNIPLYFECLYNQFLEKDTINNNYRSTFESKSENKIIKNKNDYIVKFDNKIITLNEKEYSINSFMNIFNKNSWISDLNIIKNKSQRLICKNKIFDEYFNEYINFLKKICRSNIAKKMQSLHSEFSKYETFYANDKILNDLFKNRLKFYPFEKPGLYGVTDKYLLEIYLSSIYLVNSNDDNMNEIYEEQPIILIFVNMSFNCVIFQHEGLCHYVRAYLFYNNDSTIEKISINTNKFDIYYPIQNLNKIKSPPLYLKKFTCVLNNIELNELKKDYELDKNLYSENENDVDMEDANYNNNNKNNDEGYYYERQLFTFEHENKLTNFNFLQAIMLLDEDAYYMDPIHFHYCFLELAKNNKYKFIKKNFRSSLLELLLKNIDFNKIDDINDIKFYAKRSDNDMTMEIERNVCDVMPAGIRNKHH